MVAVKSTGDAARVGDDEFDLRSPPLGMKVLWPRKPKAWAALLLRVLGWQLDFAGLPMQQLPDDDGEARHVSRGVIIAYPHTSNWDGFVGLLAVWALGLEITLWGKASLFRYPGLRWILKTAGAIPISRTDAKGAVASTVEAMRTRDQFWLGLSPEGTRRFIPGWRTGFYYVALQAQVPVGIAYLDWGRRRIGMTRFVHLTGDITQDFGRLRAAYDGVKGCVDANAAPIQPLDVQFDRRQAIVGANPRD